MTWICAYVQVVTFLRGSDIPGSFVQIEVAANGNVRHMRWLTSVLFMVVCFCALFAGVVDTVLLADEQDEEADPEKNGNGSHRRPSCAV